MRSLFHALEESGPRAFSRAELDDEPDLFAQRAALFYTPTSSIPDCWVGQGPLDVTLPLATPTFYEWMEVWAHRCPRLWVDLIQRATGKLRWRPFPIAKVSFVRYDRMPNRDIYGVCGAKALLDALKVQTTGRRDGRTIYYFGAITDDSPDFLVPGTFDEELIAEPALARTRVIVGPARSEDRYGPVALGRTSMPRPYSSSSR